LAGKEVETDEENFIQKPEEWDKAVAEELANIEGVPSMNDDAWKLVDYVRKYYLDNGIAPPIKMLTKQTGLSLKYIYQLFPKGPAKGACKIAGLPRPTGCV
jgi:tRNA 2-thiouridine synthesizing protein E